MVQSCCAFNCTQRYKTNSGVKFFRLPIAQELRNKWILAIKRKGWTPGVHARICSKHFQTGAPSKDPNHADYIPNVFTFSKMLKSSVKYEHHISSRCKKKTVLVSRKADNIDINSKLLKQEENDSEADVVTENQDVSHSGDGNSNLECYIQSLEVMEENKSLKLLIEQMSVEIQTLRNEREALKEKVVDFAEEIIQSKEKMKFYTGIEQRVFQWILGSVATEEQRFQSVPTKIQILIVCVKLRLNLTTQDLAYRFRISRRTVSRILDIWIPKLASKLC